jgi:hypothetical protein
MATAADGHEERSQKIADQLRAALLALATAGVGAAYAVSDRVADRRYWIVAAGAFVLSLACIIRSWFVAKHRALKRRDAARAKEAMPEFTPWGRKSSWLWDSLGACVLIAGAAVLAVGVWLRP